MKRIISAVLTVSIIISSASLSFAQPKTRNTETDVVSMATKVNSTMQKIEEQSKEQTQNAINNEYKKVQEKNRVEIKNTVNKNSKNQTAKKSSELDKSKQALIKKCDELVSQINKLKSYIVSKDGSFLVEFKDKATGDAVLKSIDDAIANITAFKKKIENAASSSELKKISKELQSDSAKHQVFIKRITGLTSAARLKNAYKETKALVDKLGTGINGLNISNSKLDIEDLKKKHQEIVSDLEEARADYLEAISLFSTITDGEKTDKSYKAAQAKLTEAKDELHDVLVKAKQLLVKIKTSVQKPDAIKTDDDDDEEDDDD